MRDGEGLLSPTAPVAWSVTRSRARVHAPEPRVRVVGPGVDDRSSASRPGAPPRAPAPADDLAAGGAESRKGERRRERRRRGALLPLAPRRALALRPQRLLAPALGVPVRPPPRSVRRATPRTHARPSARPVRPGRAVKGPPLPPPPPPPAPTLPSVRARWRALVPGPRARASTPRPSPGLGALRAATPGASQARGPAGGGGRSPPGALIDRSSGRTFDACLAQERGGYASRPPPHSHHCSLAPLGHIRAGSSLRTKQKITGRPKEVVTT